MAAKHSGHGPGLAFDGLQPWVRDYPNIECQVGDRLFDLHNCAHFLGYTFAADGTVTLAWHFYEPWDAIRLSRATS